MESRLVSGVDVRYSTGKSELQRTIVHSSSLQQCVVESMDEERVEDVEWKMSSRRECWQMADGRKHDDEMNWDNRAAHLFRLSRAPMHVCDWPPRYRSLVRESNV